MFMPNPTSFQHAFLGAAEREVISETHVQAIKEAKSSMRNKFKSIFDREYFEKYFYGKDEAKVYSDYIYSGDGTDPEEVIYCPEPEAKEAELLVSFNHVYFTEEYHINPSLLHGPLNIPLFMAVAIHTSTGEAIYESIANDIIDTAAEKIQSVVKEGKPPLTQKQIDTYLESLIYAAECMAQHKPPTAYRLATGEIQPDDPHTA